MAGTHIAKVGFWDRPGTEDSSLYSDLQTVLQSVSRWKPTVSAPLRGREFFQEPWNVCREHGILASGPWIPPCRDRNPCEADVVCLTTGCT